MTLLRKIALGSFIAWQGFAATAQDNNCIVFDGINDCLTLGDVNDVGTQDFTVETWFNVHQKRSNKTSLINKGMTSVGIPSNAGYSIRLGSTSENDIEFLIANENAEYTILRYQGIDVDTWYHVAGVREGNNLYMYINGELVASDVTTEVGNLNTNIALSIGAFDKRPRSDVHNYLNGRMDEVRIWNYARSQEQIFDKMDCALIENEEGILLAYNFNGTEITDLSETAHEPTPLGEPYLELSDVADVCPTNLCLDFDGIDDFVDMGDINNFGTTDFTLETWINIEALSETPMVIANKGLSSVGTPEEAGYGISVGVDQQDDIVFTIADEAGNTASVSHQGLEINTWYHVAAVRADTSIFLFIDGQFVAGANTGYIYNVDSDLPFSIAAFNKAGLSTTDGFFNGKMDELRVWNEAHFECALSQHRIHGLETATAATLSLYSFNQRYGTQLTDIGTNRVDGELQGNPVWTESDVADYCETCEAFSCTEERPEIIDTTNNEGPGEETSIAIYAEDNKIVTDIDNAVIILPSKYIGEDYIIYNALGQTVQNKTITTTNIDYSELNEGVYYFLIENENRQIKIIRK